jgi:hypothetical protein
MLGTGPTAEYLLLDYARRLARNPAGRRAVVLNLSKLRPDNRHAHHLRIAANTFEGLVKRFDGQIFVLRQGDIVFVCKDANIAAADVDDAVTKMRYLFGDDPLTAHAEEGGQDGFATWFDIGHDVAGFLKFVEGVHAEETKRQKRLSAVTGEKAPEERQPMDAAALADLVAAVGRADLSNVLRRQPVCAIAPGEPPKPIYREIYISIPELRDSIMPKRDITSDPWLFQYLTQVLDMRMLALLRRGDDRALASAYSLNLNVSTLLSPEFQAFDESLRAGARGTIVVELQKVDVFSDLGAYVFARDYVHERGYRICLDGVTGLTLPFVDRERLDLDLVKVFWRPDMAEDRGARAGEFRAALERVGRSRLILARCDSEAAIRFGHQLGLRLFQGRHVDGLLGLGSAPRRPVPRSAAGR